MAEAGELTFSFGADFSGFTRAADSAGRKLDELGRNAAQWADSTSRVVSRRLQGGLDPLRITPGIRASGTAEGDDASARELARLSDQLALLRTTGAAHDAIVTRMKTEAEQAKLGADATTGQKAAVASLVEQIGAAKTAQASLRAEQTATNQAWAFGANQAERGLEDVILYGGTLQDAARSTLLSVAHQGLEGALTGTGALAGLFGTRGGGQGGGLFGSLQGLFSGGFAGLFAGGGTIGAGQWGVTGEAGAEIVAGPATVVPWNRIARAPAGTASHQTINFNVTTPDAPSFARSESQVAALLSRAAARGQRNL